MTWISKKGKWFWGCFWGGFSKKQISLRLQNLLKHLPSEGVSFGVVLGGFGPLIWIGWLVGDLCGLVCSPCFCSL